MTERQRDLLALYCLHMGIRSPQNIKHHIEEYEKIRVIVSLCCVEMSNAELAETKRRKETGTD